MSIVPARMRRRCCRTLPCRRGQRALPPRGGRRGRSPATSFPSRHPCGRRWPDSLLFAPTRSAGRLPCAGPSPRAWRYRSEPFGFHEGVKNGQAGPARRAAVAPTFRARPGTGRRGRRAGPACRHRAGAVRRRAPRVARHAFRAFHRRAAGGLHRAQASRHCGQWPAARAAAALARGRHGDAAGDQPPARARFDPLARHPVAVPDGWRARHQLRRHRAGRDFHLSLSGAAERHLLVPQPFRLPGTDRAVWPHRDRAGRRPTLPGRPRLRGDAQRLDRRGPGGDLRAPETAGRLLQLRRAACRACARRWPNGACGTGCA
jgi:hypothetical protein